MSRKRKAREPSLTSDPHGWLVAMLREEEQHYVKAQKAVTALTGYEYIAGAEQDAGSARPFDHKAPDGTIRIDTKTQQGGELDVKKEKPVTQFMAWENSGKAFIAVQLVLDEKTNSWYLIPGIPNAGTYPLDPHAKAFDELRRIYASQDWIVEAIARMYARREEFESMYTNVNYDNFLRTITLNDNFMRRMLGEEFFETWKTNHGPQ